MKEIAGGRAGEPAARHVGKRFRMRLFVAVNFPARLRHKIARLTRPLGEAGVPGRWVEPDQVHLTLKFIGEVAVARVDDVGDALEEVTRRFRPFVMRFGPIGAFPSPRRPRVVWLGVELTPELRFIKDDLERRLAELGVDRSARPYQPHVTLGRAPRDAEAGEFRRLEEVARGLRIADEYRVTHLDLMRSQIQKSGAVHTRLRVARLGSRGG